MNNELIKQQIPITEIMSIGKAFVESGMFPDVKTAAQAVVKIQAGQEIGVAPFAAMSGIHIIQGRPTLGAGLIASKIKSSGKYDYKIIKMTEQVCSIDFYQGKEHLGNSTFDLVDAKKAGTKNLDKFPKNMLFARAISNGVKWFCPDVFNGPVYTPEDFNTENKTEDTAHEEILDPLEIQVRTKYETPEDIEIVLDSCEVLGQVRNLYHMNSSVVEANPELKAKFTEKKNLIQKVQLNGHATTV